MRIHAHIRAASLPCYAVGSIINVYLTGREIVALIMLNFNVLHDFLLILEVTCDILFYVNKSNRPSFKSSSTRKQATMHSATEMYTLKMRTLKEQSIHQKQHSPSCRGGNLPPAKSSISQSSANEMFKRRENI